MKEAEDEAFDELAKRQGLSEAQSWDIDQYIRMMHDSTKLKETT